MMLDAYHTQGVCTMLSEGLKRSKYRFLKLTSLKHFPGLGRTSVDIHEGLAKVPMFLKELKKVEWKSYKDTAYLASSIMVGYVWVTALDAEMKSSSFSRAVLKQLKKVSRGFKGHVITDAVDMGALEEFPKKEIFKEAFLGGIHIILLPYPESAVDEYYQAAQELFTSQEFRESDLNQRLQRIVELKLFLQNFLKARM